MATLRPENLEVRVPRQQFPLAVTAGSLAVVLQTGTRLQRVADVLALHWNWCGVAVATASYYSVRLGVLRLGLYQLNRPKVQAEDWIWIIDRWPKTPSSGRPSLRRSETRSAMGSAQVSGPGISSTRDNRNIASHPDR